MAVGLLLVVFGLLLFFRTIKGGLAGKLVSVVSS